MADFEVEMDVMVTDPVCARRLALETAAAQEEYSGWAYFFCSTRCHQLFLATPERYAVGPPQILTAPSRQKK